ncbi:MAG: endonuclease [Clostridia bacterium]|nr:endonuclease [Clostridia bacterium]
MKNVMKRSFAVLMTLVMCASVLFGMNLSVFAADTNTVNYVYDGSYIYNWGTRGTNATFLSPNAETFYTENGVTLSELLALDGSSTESGVPSSALYTKLKQLMTDNHSYIISYDNTRGLFMYTDCENSGDPSTISSFYSGVAIGPEWDSGSTWNREHTWPNSKGDLAGSGENDIMMLRPAATSENGSRGNKAYGTATDTSYFYPNIGSYDLRGDVARIILYQYVRWGCTNTGSGYNPDGIFGTEGVIESQDVLLTWIEEDPVDTWELGRNDSVEAITGTRNVFVDYPELAFDLFEEGIPQHTTPSGYAASDGAVGGGSTGNDTIGDTTTDATGNYYVKVTEAPTDWSGNYLIVYETGSKAFNGALTADAAQNNISVTISDGKIPVSEETSAAAVTLEKLDSGYAIKVQNGNYISQSGTDAKIVYGSTAFAHSLSIDGDATTIANASNTEYMLMFNATSGQERFRYYRGTQKAVALYKLETVDDTTGDSGDSGDTGSGDSGSTENTVEVNATIDFSTTDQRVSQTAEQQVWSNAGLTFTNDKSNSTNDIIDSSNPVRLYANSSITLQHTGKIKEIKFTANTAAYATALSESIGTVIGATVATDTEDAKIVTVTFDTPVDSFTLSTLTAQVRLNSITVTALDTPIAYVVTAQSNDDAYGTVEVSGKYITATPATGYEIDSTNPYTIVSGTATVTQNVNTFTVEATSDVTVQINFKERAKGTVSYSQHGTVALTEDIYIGNTTTLPTHIGNVPLGWKFEGWIKSNFDGETTTKPEILAVDYTHTVEADITFYAVYSRSETTESTSQATKQYVKITSDSELTDGQYLIVYETGNVAFNGALTTLDAASNNISVTINDGTIEATDTTNAANFTIDTTAGTIQSASGYYIGNTADSNKLNSSTSTQYTNTITINTDGSAHIVGSGNSVLRYNASSGNYRFRYFKSSTYTNQKAIHLYKLTEGAAGGTTTVTTYYYFTNGTITDNETDGYYIKVTKDQTDWSGEYLIVYENDSVVFDGGRETLDQAHNVIKNVALNGGVVKAKQSLDAAKIIIEKSGDGYTLKTADGTYIGPLSTGNGITTGTADIHTITLVDGALTITGSTGKVLTFNSTNNKDNYRFRYYTNAQKSVALYKYVDIDATISSAQVSVGADLSIRYGTTITTAEDLSNYTLEMRFSIDDTVIDTVTGTVVDGQYVFDFAGLAPQRMADIIKAELLINGGIIDVKDDYSIKQNAINLLADNPSDELVQFITDMLYYGAAAQTYTKYNTDNLATSGVKGLGTPSTATPDDTWDMSPTNNSTPDTVYFRSATVWFDSVNKLIIKLNSANENTQLYVNDKLVEINYDSETGVYSYTTDEILVTEFDTVYTFKLYDNNILVQTLNYSVNAYAYSKQNSNNMANLALALYRFGKSADAYNATL